MRIFKWSVTVERIPRAFTLPLPPVVTTDELRDKLLAMAHGEAVVRNVRTGENVWIRPFNRDPGKIIRGVGSIAALPVLPDDEWILLKVQNAPVVVTPDA